MNQDTISLVYLVWLDHRISPAVTARYYQSSGVQKKLKVNCEWSPEQQQSLHNRLDKCSVWVCQYTRLH